MAMIYHLRRVSDLLYDWKSCLLCHMKDVVLHCSIFFKWNEIVRVRVKKNGVKQDTHALLLLFHIYWSLFSISSKVFLAATKQLYEWYFLSVCLSVCPSVSPSVCLSVCLSVCPSHLFDYVPIIVSSLNFQELSPRAWVTSRQKVKVRGQRSRSQRSQPNVAVSGL